MHCVCKRATEERHIDPPRTASQSSINIDTFAREASHLGDLGRVREDRRPGLDLREVVLVCTRSAQIVPRDLYMFI